MVEYLTIKNFLSYRDRTELSFLASKKEGGADQLPPKWYKEIDGKRLLRLLVCVGLNGTGKSKMISAFSYLRTLATLKPEKPTDKPSYRPFLLDDTSKYEPTQMWLSSYFGEDNYEYYIQVSKDRIEVEELRLLAGRGQRVFLRKYNPETDTAVISFGMASDLSKSDQRDLEVNTLNNSTVLASFGAMNLESKVLKSNYDYFANRISRIRKSDQSLAEKLSTGDSKKDDLMKRLLLQLLKDVGTNIVDYKVDSTFISIEELMKKGAPDFVIEAMKQQYPSGVIGNKVLSFEHATSNGTRSLDSKLESLGTLNIIRLLTVLYDVVLAKKCTCVDEIETGIHTTALEFILKMYLSLADECQLIAATHDLQFLNTKFLRRDAVRMYSKNEDGVTTVKRPEYLHNTMNFYKKYITEISDDIKQVMEDSATFIPYRDVIEESQK